MASNDRIREQFANVLDVRPGGLRLAVQSPLTYFLRKRPRRETHGQLLVLAKESNMVEMTR